MDHKDMTLEQKVDRILEILEPLADFVENDLPVLKERVGPMLDALSNSPVFKMLGVR